MMIGALLVLGLLLGLGATILSVRMMMNKAGTRIWLANFANFSRGRPPEHCQQLVRHGKWIAGADKDEQT